MIKLSNLPQKIFEVAKRYEQKGENLEVFPAKFFIDGQLYYYFHYNPSQKELIIKENGEVPPVHSIEKVFCYANGFNASIHAMATIGEKWRKSGMGRKYARLKRLLSKVEKFIESGPEDVRWAFTSFQKVPDVIIKHQKVIERSVNQARRETVEMRKREIVTEDDYKRMRGYQEDTARSGFWQTDIQFKTAADREKVMDYLSSIKSITNWKAWWYYLQLKPYQKMMYTKEKNPKEYEEMQELSEEIFEDVPIEENPEVLDLIKNLRNPR